MPQALASCALLSSPEVVARSIRSCLHSGGVGNVDRLLYDLRLGEVGTQLCNRRLRLGKRGRQVPERKSCGAVLKQTTSRGQSQCASAAGD